MPDKKTIAMDGFSSAKLGSVAGSEILQKGFSSAKLQSAASVGTSSSASGSQGASSPSSGGEKK